MPSMRGYWKHIGNGRKVYMGYIPYMQMYLQFFTIDDYKRMFEAYAKVEGGVM